MSVILAMLLDALLGEPKVVWSRLPHPAILMGRAVAFADTRLNHGPWLRLKGVLAVVVLVLGAGLLGVVLQTLGPVAEVIVGAILLAQKSLVQHVGAVAQGLREGVAPGRAAVAMIVSRDTGALDRDGVARAAIESAAENLSDGVIAPLFWFVLAGLPGLLVYKIVNTADSMIGYRTPRYAAFGWAAARLDDLLNLIPARLTALLIALPHGQWRALPAIWRDARRHRSPNAGWPEAAMARALGIALAGPRVYHGQSQDLAWVNGAGRRPLLAQDVEAAVAILWQTWAWALCGLATAAIICALLS